MKRIVGLRKGGAATKTPERGLQDVVQDTDRKSNELDSKAEQCNAELRKISQQLKDTHSDISRQMLQEKAKSILIRKKRFEQQAESLREKSFNVDSLASTITSANDTALIASALKSGTKQMKKELKKVNLEEIEDQQDELADLIELTEDVQNSLSKNYDVPDDISDEELNNQLELLGDEIIRDNDSSYIDEVMRLPPPKPNADGKFSSGNGGPGGLSFMNGPGSQALDEFGLPILNSNDMPGTLSMVSNEANPLHPESKH